MKNQTPNLTHLPLSWNRSNHPQLHLTTIKLPPEPITWIATADIPQAQNFPDIFPHIQTQTNNRYMIRGCNQELAAYLKQQGAQIYHVGQEANLHLDGCHFQKRSLRDLVRRGSRHGTIHQRTLTPSTLAQLKTLQKASRHGNEPQLHHLYRNQWPITDRTYTYETPSGHWLAAITLSSPAPQKYHAELLLRHRQAPVGVMEAMIHHIYQQLRQEGNRIISLGEVPYIGHPRKTPRLTKINIIPTVGHLTRFAYNYEGLYRFKNKFQPDWQNLYLCIAPQLRYRHLWTLARKTNYLNLLWFHAQRRIRMMLPFG